MEGTTVMALTASSVNPATHGNAAAGDLSGRRAAALAGVTSAVLLFLGVFILNPPLNASDAELVDWWSNESNQAAATVSMYLFTAAALSFLGFLTHLCARISADERGRQPAQLVLGCGIVFSTMLAVAAAARGVVGKAVAFNDQPLPGADTLRYLMQTASAALGVVAMLAAAVAIVAVTYAVLRTGVFGRWLAWLGVIAAVVLLAVQATFVGELAIPAILIWTVAASAAIWRSPSTIDLAVR